MRKENEERHMLKLDFWAGFLERDGQTTRLYVGRSPITGGDLTAKTGTPGVEWLCRLNEHQVGVYLKSVGGSGSGATRAALFHRLHATRVDVEAAFDGPLTWETTARGVGLIGLRIVGGYRDARAQWPHTHEEMVKTLARLEKTMTPYLQTGR